MRSQGVPALIVELGVAVLDQDLAESADRPQRGPEVVGDGVGEGLELAVRRVDGLLGQAQRFEGIAEPAVGGLGFLPLAGEVVEEVQHGPLRLLEPDLLPGEILEDIEGGPLELFES